MSLLKASKQNYLELLPPAMVFFVASTLLLVAKRLILSEYGISWIAGSISAQRSLELCWSAKWC